MCKIYAQYLWHCEDDMAGDVVEELKIGWCAKRKVQEARPIHTGSYSPCSVREIVSNDDDDSRATYKHWKMCGYCEGHWENEQYDLIEANAKECKGEAEEEGGVSERALDIIFSDLRAQAVLCFDDYFRDKTSMRYDNTKTRLDNHTGEMQRKVHSLILQTRAKKSEIRFTHGKVERQG